MKEEINRTVVEIDCINPSTGEVFKVEGTIEQRQNYYSISKITSRINAMDFLKVLELTCKSSKDISIINVLTESIGNDNTVRIASVTELAKDLEISRQKLTNILKDLQDVGFLHKLDMGIYMMNPYIYVGRRVSSNKLRELAQRTWDKEINKTLGK